MRAVLLAIAGLGAITAGLAMCPWLGPWAALVIDGSLALWLGLVMETGKDEKAGDS